ncbi:MAG: M17 family peptidase N-terminal domain-containing protein [Candidatus Manganitrophaceae bacterium]
MRIGVYSGKLTKLRTEVLAVPCFEDIRPLRGWAGEIDWLYGSVFSNLLMKGKINGKLGEMLLLATEQRMQISKVILVGLGRSAAYDCLDLGLVGRRIAETLVGLHAGELAVELQMPLPPSVEMPLLIDAFMKGMEEVEYPGPLDLTFVVADVEKAKALERKIRNGLSIGNPSHSLAKDRA